MIRYTAAVASDERFTLGEGPVLDSLGGRLLWVDILGGTAFEGRLAGNRVEVTRRHEFDCMVGAIVPAMDGGLLIAVHEHLVRILPSGEHVDGPVIVKPGIASRANDGAVDPSGRFVIGTLALDDRIGCESLVRLEHDGTLSAIDVDLKLSNGLAWSPDGSLFYSTDTADQVIWERSYPPEGPPGARREYLRIADGYPDGICMDGSGNLWVAIWGSGQVRCYSPEGIIVATVVVDAPQTSSVAFIGEQLDTLLITTASTGMTAEQMERHPNSGRLFLAVVDAVGVPSSQWAQPDFGHPAE